MDVDEDTSLHVHDYRQIVSVAASAVMLVEDLEAGSLERFVGGNVDLQPPGCREQALPMPATTTRQRTRLSGLREPTSWLPQPQ